MAIALLVVVGGDPGWGLWQRMVAWGAGAGLGGGGRGGKGRVHNCTTAQLLLWPSFENVMLGKGGKWREWLG